MPWSNHFMTRADSTNISVAAFAEAGKFDEANAALAALANVPVDVAENMMVETCAEGVMILARVASMSWSTVRLIINMRDGLSDSEPTDLEACQATYERLRPSTAPTSAALPSDATDRTLGGIAAQGPVQMESEPGSNLLF